MSDHEEINKVGPIEDSSRLFVITKFENQWVYLSYGT